MNGGDLLVRTLHEMGVEVVFGLPGVHNLAAWEALASSNIRLIGTRHEQAAVYAADGYARATGRLGVAITTTGPGAANTLGALGEAWASHSPVLVIATDIPSTLRRPGVYRGVLHETVDQASMFTAVTKQTFVVHRAADLVAGLQASAGTALAAPTGTAYLQIPTDLLSAPMHIPTAPGTAPEAGAAPKSAIAQGAPPGPPRALLAGAAELLAGASRPLIWAGGGATASGAGDVLAAVADRLAAPVITTYQARGLLGPEHPLAAGLPPHLPRCGALWDAADVVLAVGTDFDAMMTQNWLQPAPRALVTVNIDGADAAKAYPPDVSLVGDASAVLTALLPLLADRGAAARQATAADLAGRREQSRAELSAEAPAAMDFLGQLARQLPASAIVVADMCIPGYWFGALGQVGGPRRLAYPVGWGTLGFGFPAAIGSATAAALHGLGPVVCLCGDGGFLFAAGELATLAQEQLPLTVVIVDDGGYGMLRYDQRHAGQQAFGVDLLTPDFAALAAAFGLRAQTVEGLGADFGTALAEHLADPRPTVLVALAALDPPPTTSPRWYRKSGPSGV